MYYLFVLQAGLASPDDPDQLLIALEPEAASFYCRTLQMKDFLGESGDEFVNEGLASYIVIDNGGLSSSHLGVQVPGEMKCLILWQMYPNVFSN